MRLTCSLFLLQVNNIIIVIYAISNPMQSGASTDIEEDNILWRRPLSYG